MPHRVRTDDEGACKWLETYKVLFTLSRSCRGRQGRKNGAVMSFSEARREPGNQDQTGLSPSVTSQASKEKGEDARAPWGQVEVVDVAAATYWPCDEAIPPIRNSATN